MATLNLGRIKPVFKGAYNNATAYVVDDIVTSGNETFICILASTGNATSNATYWTKLAAKGTDGTDVGTTLTTQGDILYRDGSGLQRLPKGTAGQVLKMNAAANAPEYGTISTDFVKLASGYHSGGTNLIIDNLDVASYNTFRIHLQNCLTQTSNTQTLFLRFRYDNSGTQTTYSVAAHTYVMRGRYAKGGSGDTGESSGTSEETGIRLNWALSKNTNDRYSQSFELMTSELNNTANHKDVRIMSYGTYYNNTEYSMYNYGVGICRQATQVFNGFDIYAAENWKGDYQIYGIK